jgi:hypothetical protein
MMALIGAPIDIQLAREHVRELQAAAEQYRREHPGPLPAGDHAAPRKQVGTRIRRVLATATHRGGRTRTEVVR